MASEWTLNIDLIRSPGRVMAVFGLLNPGRSQSWKLVCPVLGGVYQDLVALISEFFAPGDNDSAQTQREALDRVISLAGATFYLDDLLGKARFGPNDTLALSTLATAIPWDMLPYDGGCLGQKLGIGLRIPAPPSRARPRTVDGGSSRPQFLHVIANPRRDLHHAAAEAEALRALVERQAELEYRWIQYPTPDELASELGKCKRATPYFHFTGHVKPGCGLELKNGILGCEELTKYFPGTSEQIVMFNGCDALWEGSPGGGDPNEARTGGAGAPDIVDVFQSASVAGAFLDAGAGAVIAPRSRIVDSDARRAAELVWERVFAGDGLGHVVRQVGQRLSGTDCALQSGYSYVLYGAPSARVRQRSSVADRLGGVVDAISNQPVLLEACGDAGGAAEPRHIFAALSRRWIIGQAYFERERNRYIETLESLRLALRVSAAPLPAARVDLSPAAQRMLTDANKLRAKGQDLGSVSNGTYGVIFCAGVRMSMDREAGMSFEIAAAASALRTHLRELVESQAFKGSRRGQQFLEYIVEKALTGHGDELKERNLGVELFGRTPAYDTGQDAIVRVTASDVRKRLHQFYSETPSAYRIEIPSGSYTPHFHAIASQRPPLVAPASAVAGSRWRQRAILAGLLLVAAASSATVVWQRNRAPAIQAPHQVLPWSALLQSGHQIQLVFADVDVSAIQELTGSRISLSDYANRSYLSIPESAGGDMRRALHLLRGVNVAAVDVGIALAVSRLAGDHRARLKINPARSLHMGSFKSDDDFIILGSPRSNPWNSLFEDQLDFDSVHDPEVKGEVIRNRRIQPGELPRYVPTARGWDTGHAFATIALVGNPNQAGKVLLVAGTNAESTEAAGQMVANSGEFARTLRTHGIDPSGPAHPFQLLLQVRTMAGSPSRVEVVASHRLPDATEPRPVR